MSGRLVISLDFELMWGVRDHSGIAEYGDAVIGARRAIPLMLKLFAAYGVRATWATVGLLFAKDRAHLQHYLPEMRPRYAGIADSPYAFIADGLGRDEAADPWHFGRSLVDRIAQTPGQELATHSFSHFCCLEPGHTVDAFRADLRAARAIMADAGQQPRSIVFARNQYAAEHIAAARTEGFDVYRGTQDGFAYRSRAKAQNTLPVRAARLASGLSPVGRRADFHSRSHKSGTIDIRASRFLRPWSPRRRMQSQLEDWLIGREMRAAARRGTIYHLWWHPHNMGRYTEGNLARLDAILRTFRTLHDELGMMSSSMGDLAGVRAPA